MLQRLCSKCSKTYVLKDIKTYVDLGVNITLFDKLINFFVDKSSVNLFI